jgi:serine/threonine protein phosphatase 1
MPDQWLASGGRATIKSYEGFSKERKESHINFLRLMPDYYLDDSNRLFVHAGFTSMHGVLKEQNPINFRWDRTLWEMVLSMNTSLTKDSNFYPKRLRHYSEIFIGHTPTTHYNEALPMHFANVWNIDTGAAFKGKLTIMNVDTKQYWQSDPLPLLYPDEMGRNAI